jgi:hypothetical protein
MESVFNALTNEGVFEYGAMIHKEELLKYFGIQPLSEDEANKLSFTAIKTRIQEDALQELAVTDFIRDRLLDEGKYFYRNGKMYCVALPSQNSEKADAYLKSAQRKIKRASRLLANTPKEVSSNSKQQQSRLLMTAVSAQRQQNRT